MIGKWKHGVAILVVVMMPRAASAAITDILDNAIDIVTSGFDYLWPDKLDKKDLRFRLGIGFGASPDYVGSDNYRTRTLPLIDVRYKDKFVLQGTKLRINVIKSKAFKAGPMLNYKFGRSANSNPVLNNWGHVHDTVQLGGFVEMRHKNMLMSADMRASMGASMGYEANGLIAHGLYKDERFTMFAGARLKWSSKSYNQTMFGVSAAQSDISGLPAYHPGAGLSSTDINLVGRYRLQSHLFLEALIGNMLVLDDAASSPLVKDWGNRHQVIGGVGLRYAF